MIKPLPEILITGFPNSGTSFLCNLIIALGKFPGDPRNLKKGDKHNRWGYFEHLGIREISHQALPQGYFRPYEQEFLPPRPNSFPSEKLKEYSQKITEIAKRENIQVYKDNALPLVFRIFPREAKYIVIKRDPKECFQSPQKGGHSKISCSFEEFLGCYQKYYDLVTQMAKEVACLEVCYEDFFDNFDAAAYKIAQFIKVKVDDKKLRDCKKIFRPRRSFFQS